MEDTSSEWLDRRLFPFTSRYLEIQGHRIHYIDEGTGPVLLLLHGNPTWSFLYRHIITRLSGRFRCIALDYPGFGLSRARETSTKAEATPRVTRNNPARPRYGFTPREHSQVVEEFVDALKLTDITVMVQDWGGPIGLGWAGRHPDRVRALIIGNTFAWPATPGMAAFSRIVGSTLGRYLITQHHLLARWLIPSGINRPLTDAELAAYLGPCATPAARLPIWIFARNILASHDYLMEVEASMARLAEKPTLIVWADADGAFRLPDRDRFQGIFSKHQTVMLPGAKHYIQENASELICDAILQWFH